MKKYLFIILVLSATIAEAQTSKDSTKFHVGVEADILPYLTGGYYGSVWISKNHFRYRAIVTQVTTPDFLVEDGFTNNEVNVYAFITDYFFKPEVNKFWVGAGIEYWKAKIQTDLEAEEAKYDNVMLTLGGGYVWNLGKHLYLNPWIAVHARVAGDSEATVDGEVFKPAAIVPEGSLKIGWRFN